MAASLAVAARSPGLTGATSLVAGCGRRRNSDAPSRDWPEGADRMQDGDEAASQVQFVPVAVAKDGGPNGKYTDGSNGPVPANGVTG